MNDDVLTEDERRSISMCRDYLDRKTSSIDHEHFVRFISAFDRLAALLAEQRPTTNQDQIGSSSVDEPQWVKCSERLPDECVDVWLYFPDTGKVVVGYTHGSYFVAPQRLDRIESKAATHWLPCTPPTPPVSTQPEKEDSTNA